MAQLVESLEQVVENATHFAGIGDARDSVAYEVLNSFVRWYYFRGLGVFAPSKFIGYIDTTVKNYDGEGRNGTHTERELKQWFRKIDPEKHAEAFRRWLPVLERYVQGLGGRINQKLVMDVAFIFYRMNLMNCAKNEDRTYGWYGERPVNGPRISSSMDT